MDAIDYIVDLEDGSRRVIRAADVKSEDGALLALQPDGARDRIADVGDWRTCMALGPDRETPAAAFVSLDVEPDFELWGDGSATVHMLDRIDVPRLMGFRCDRVDLVDQTQLRIAGAQGGVDDSWQTSALFAHHVWRTAMEQPDEALVINPSLTFGDDNLERLMRIEGEAVHGTANTFGFDRGDDASGGQFDGAVRDFQALNNELVRGIGRVTAVQSTRMAQLPRTLENGGEEMLARLHLRAETAGELALKAVGAGYGFEVAEAHQDDLEVFARAHAGEKVNRWYLERVGAAGAKGGDVEGEIAVLGAAFALQEVRIHRHVDQMPQHVGLMLMADYSRACTLYRERGIASAIGEASREAPDLVTEAAAICEVMAGASTDVGGRQYYRIKAADLHQLAKEKQSYGLNEAAAVMNHLHREQEAGFMEDELEALHGLVPEVGSDDQERLEYWHGTRAIGSARNAISKAAYASGESCSELQREIGERKRAQASARRSSRDGDQAFW